MRIPYQGIGHAIREMRKVRGLTQVELSERSGIDRTYIAKLESGTSDNPGTKIVARLLKALDFTMDFREVQPSMRVGLN